MRIFALVVIIFFARIASAQVLINEIAWMGTSDSSSNEWAELSNAGSNTDLTGWVLRIVGKKDIVLSGNIAPNGYYLIERTDDNTVPTVTADLINAFGGFVDTGAVLVLLDGSGKEQDRVDGSDGWKIGGGEVKGNKTTKETAQRNGLMWITATPTPRSINAGVSAQSAPDAPAGPQNDQGAPVNNEAVSTTAKNNVSYFPVEPQIFSKITAQTQTVSVGAATTFTGRVWGLKKEPIENARVTWTFGDGATSEGSSVLHTYYYPGEYTIVLDASSGYYAASDRVRVIAVMPLLALRTGGDETHSFIAIENRGNDELDLSEWQVHAQGKTFMLPKNTLVGVRKTLTLASEVTGLTTSAGSVASLHFPNGTLVSLQKETTSAPTTLAKEVVYIKPAVHAIETKTPPQENQEASVIGATQGLLPENSKTDLWVWYVGVAFFAAIALLGLRFVRKTSTPGLLTADDFEITDESESGKNDLF